MSDRKQLALLPLLLVGLAVVFVWANHGGHSRSPDAGRPHGDASFVIVLRKSACWEDLTSAFIRCDIRVRNHGTAAGSVPDVNVNVRYSDGSTSFFTNGTDALNSFSEPGGHRVPRGGTADVFLAHSYNEQAQLLLQAAASLDISASRFPVISVTQPWSG